MTKPRFTTLVEQLAQEIRDGVNQGRWHDKMPGRQILAQELGVNHKTCDSALQLLESQGVLISGGKGHPRKIAKTHKAKPQKIRVRMLRYERDDVQAHYLVETIHRLRGAGHDASIVENTMAGFGMNTKRIIRYISKIEADAWIVLAGSKELLEWFEQQSISVYAICGHFISTSVAGIGPCKSDAMRKLLDQLIELNHQRIVLINRRDRRKPNLGRTEREFLKRLEHHGIQTGDYNMPDWGDDPDEFREGLTALFRYTPPTAIIVDDRSLFLAVMQQLGELGLKVPKDVSLVCLEWDPAFEWCRPKITHVRWSSAPLINRTIKWAKNISLGKEDKGQTTIKAKLIAGEMIGLAKEDSWH